jgi:Na+/H+ antiporter NhaD/arsenite permease-like protein
MPSLDRTLVAMLGCLLLVALVVPDQEQPSRPSNSTSFFLFAGVTMLPDGLRRTGVFEYVAKLRASPSRT